FHLARYLALRIDVRDVISHARGRDETFTAHNPEVMLGLSLTLGRKKDAPPKTCGPVSCPQLPEPPPDQDGDGIPDAEDGCPTEAETVNCYLDGDGCPETDTDGDGVYDDADECVDVPGTEANGCPPPDADGDGIPDAVDACKNEPETRNGFEDADGCPDELPKEITRFVGVIEGITFDTGKDTIKKSSF